MITGLLKKDMRRYLPSVIAPAIMGLIAIPIVTRLFPPGDYGNYVLVIATVGIFSTIVGWLSMSVIRFYPAYERDGKLDEFYANIIKLTIISILVISLAFLSILLFIRSRISTDVYSLMRIGILVFILTSGFGILLHFLRAKRQVNWYTGFSVWKSITALGFGILLIMAFHFGVEGLLWGSILSVAVVFPLLWKKAVGKVSLGPRNISLPLTSEMAKYGFPLVVGSLAAWILSLSDRYILELFRGSHEVGIYSASYAISEHSILLIATLFWLASTPIEMSMWEKQGKRASQEFISEVTRYYLLIGLPAAVGLSVLAKPVIAVFTGPEYYQGYTIIPLVTFGAFLLGLQRRFSSGLTFYKKTNLIMAAIIVSGLLNLGLNFLLIPKYGYMAAAFTTLLSYAFLVAAMGVVSRKYFIWEFPFKVLAKAVCASVVMGIVVYYVGGSLTSSALLNLILGVCSGTLVYIMMLFLLREFRPSEIQALLALKAKIWGSVRWQNRKTI